MSRLPSAACPPARPAACAARAASTSIFALAVALAISALPAMGQTPVSDSQQAVRLVMDRHPDLAAAGFSADALRAHAEALGALPDPKIDLTWSPYRVFTARGSQRSRLSVEQTIPWPGLRAARSRAVRSAADRLDHDGLRLARDLAEEAKLAWNRAWLADALTRNALEFKESLQGFESSATNRYETGEEAMAPLISIQIERQALDLAIEQYAENRLLARRDLARLANAPDLVLPDSLLLVETLGATDPVRTALASRPELHALESLRLSRLEDLEVARLLARPDFSVGMNWVDTAEEAFLPNGDGRDAVGLRLGITVPLWGAARRAPKERARLGVAEVDAQIRARQTAIQTEVTELGERLESQREQLRQLQDVLLPRAEIARTTALTAYRAGVTSLLQVLDSERTRYALRKQAISTQSRLNESLIRLERAIGLGASRQ